MPPLPLLDLADDGWRRLFLRPCTGSERQTGGEVDATHVTDRRRLHEEWRRSHAAESRVVAVIRQVGDTDAERHPIAGRRRWLRDRARAGDGHRAGRTRALAEGQ